jgi:hypothetical protein
MIERRTLPGGDPVELHAVQRGDAGATPGPPRETPRHRSLLSVQRADPTGDVKLVAEGEHGPTAGARRSPRVAGCLGGIVS